MSIQTLTNCSPAHITIEIGEQNMSNTAHVVVEDFGRRDNHNGNRDCTVKAKAKPNRYGEEGEPCTDKGAPFTVVNEIVCSRLGQFIGLNIPPFGVAILDDRPHFISVLFDGIQTTPEEFVRIDPRMATGVFAFDVYVINGDRNRDSILRNGVMHQHFAFDFGHALFGFKKGRDYGDKNELREHGSNTHLRFKYFDKEDGLGVFGHEQKDDKTKDHCFMELIPNGKYLAEWTNRIKEIPDWLIQSAIDDAWHFVGKEQALTAHEKLACYDFLIRRRDRVKPLIERFLPKMRTA